MNPTVNPQERTSFHLCHYRRERLHPLFPDMSLSLKSKRWPTKPRQFVAEFGIRNWREGLACQITLKLHTPFPLFSYPRTNWAIAPECSWKCGQFYLHAGIMIGTWPVAVRHHIDSLQNPRSGGRLWAPEQNHKDNHNVVGWLAAGAST